MKDFRIIEQLNSDGRLSLRKIAEELDYSPSTVSNHFRELRDNGVIQGFKPQLDYSKLGFSFTCITQIKAEAGKQTQVASTLAEKGYIHSLYQVTGDTDIIAICKFRNREEMRENLTQDLNQLEGITDTKTNVALNSKIEGRPIDLTSLKEEHSEG
ncbi:MAG: Lrp/AsnC family transcriptional regulator [Candidatus Nanohalobium sp.]